MSGQGALDVTWMSTAGAYFFFGINLNYLILLCALAYGVVRLAIALIELRNKWKGRND